MKLKDILRKHEDGSYEPLTPISINRPDGSVVSIGPGTKLIPGVKFSGIDIMDLLEKEVSTGSSGSDSMSGTSTNTEKKSAEENTENKGSPN